ncbi:MAG TPA: MFS transporter [Steroidobacteraceae bacterium]|nr:MFS transporter [Steroidobacteraceae bacterium]
MSSNGLIAQVDSLTAPTPLWALTHRVRWRIYSFLFVFGCIAYFQKLGLTVAADRMMPDLHITQAQLAWLEWALVLGYTAAQFPGGILGRRLGARRAFVLISCFALLGTVLTPLAPELLHGMSLIGVLLALQLVVGLAQGPIFPVSSGVMEAWFPPEKWPLVQGLQSAGLQLAAALTAPIVAYLMTFLGWQQALFWPALPAVLVIAAWGWYARNTPTEHRAVTAQELAELGPIPPAQPQGPMSWERLRRLLSNRSILLLTCSYVCMNYSFYLIANWCFLYLVQERHFNVLEGGWLATLPPLAAAVGAGLGGKLVMIACARLGNRWGFRAVPLLALPLTGVLLLATVHLGNPYAAVIALALAYAAVELTEGPYWAGTMFIARSETMPATGVLNTGGNLGGLIGIPIVGYLSGSGHWTFAFGLGAIFSVLGALAWLGIDAEQSFDRPAGRT